MNVCATVGMEDDMSKEKFDIRETANCESESCSCHDDHDNDSYGCEDGGCGCGCSDSHDHEEGSSRRELIEMIAGAILFAAGLALHFIFEMRDLFTIPVFIASYLVLGYEILIGAAKGLFKKRVFGEDFLMSVASLGAFAVGSFEEAVGVMLFYRVGEWFEHRAAGSARRSVTALLRIRPDTANVLTDGEITVTAPSEVTVGSIILIKPGERIPLDGTVTDGISALDTSALTGEALPRDVAPGDTVLSGCVNVSGVLTVRVDKPFGESTVEKILELVENSAAKKAPAEKFITKFARIYTPAVVILAVLVAAFPPLLGLGEFAVWIKKALTLLVISCPCALVLSIPLAFFHGIGTASKRGVLIKGGNYLDALKNLEIVAFDKTGTLTRGVFEVSEICPVDGVSNVELLEVAAHAEVYSTHPIARSIVKAYRNTPDTDRITNCEEIAGNGVRAELDGKSVLAGSAAFLENNGIICPVLSAVGALVYIATDDEYIGYIAVTDSLRPDSARVITELHHRGIKTVMLTGDNEASASAIASQLGFSEYRAALLPQDKVAAVEELSQKTSANGTLVFVGDGINDAPVLAIADIGVAMGGLGSDAAIESADMLLMNDEPSKLVTAYDIALRTRKIVLQNIILSLGVKLLFLALGVFGNISMWLAVFADVGVALLAVLNSVRIGRRV